MPYLITIAPFLRHSEELIATSYRGVISGVGFPRPRREDSLSTGIEIQTLAHIPNRRIFTILIVDRS